MTTDVVTAPAQTRIGELARRMLDAHIHRVFILDAQGRPAGVVTATDILAAVTPIALATNGGSGQVLPR